VPRPTCADVPRGVSDVVLCCGGAVVGRRREGLTGQGYTGPVSTASAAEVTERSQDARPARAWLAYASAVARLADTQELLDGPTEIDVLRGNLRDMARVNRWLGGTVVSRRAIVHLASRGRSASDLASWRDRPLRLLDVGTGAADIPRSLQRWLARHAIRLEIEAVDRRPQILDVAREQVGERPDLRFARADGENLPYPDASFDIAHCSLLVHHLEPGRATALLGEMARVSRIGVVVNDLDRTRHGYLGAWLLSRLATRNRYTRHDAPLSVRRAYRPAEIIQLATGARLVEAARFRDLLAHRYALAFVPADTPPHGPRDAARDDA
jgi:SAM-dependent methyltransferase